MRDIQTPLLPDEPRSWLAERPGNDRDPLFTSVRGGRLSRDAVERIVQKYAAVAIEVACTLVPRVQSYMP